MGALKLIAQIWHKTSFLRRASIILKTGTLYHYMKDLVYFGPVCPPVQIDLKLNCMVYMAYHGLAHKVYVSSS